MSNVIKGNYGYSFREDNTKVIDTNSLVAGKLEELSRMVPIQADAEDDFEETFTQGIDAMQVERLLADDSSDGDEESSSNVIKAPPPEKVRLAQAGEEAQAMLDRARGEAEDIVSAARAEADSVRKEAVDEGHRAGYDAGYEDGTRKAAEEFEQRAAQLAQKDRELEERYESALSQLEPQMVEIFTDIYEHVFHVSFSEKKEVLFYLIQDALRKAESGKNFIIHVSAQDHEFISSKKGELSDVLAGGGSVEVIEDITMKAAECFIDTGSGIFDCSVDTELEALKKELRLLSYSPGGN